MTGFWRRGKKDLLALAAEARFPYPDRILMDYVRRIPPRLRIKGLTRRYIQKRAMKDSLPPEICRRQNMGLEMPHSKWFLTVWRDRMERVLSRENVQRSGLLDYGAVRGMWDAHLSRKKDYGRALWCLLQFLTWFDLFVYNRDYKRHIR